MSKRVEWKVGLFVLLGLVLAGAMAMRFSKGTGLSTTYRLNLVARDAGGIIPGAAVLMAGVPVGSIREIRLKPDGSEVTMVANLYSRIKIARDAEFGIATVGFLGEKYVYISPGQIKPGEKHPGFRHDGDTVPIREAFDLSVVAQSASELMARVGSSLVQLSNVVNRLDTSLLTTESLGNLSETLRNVREVSARAISAVDGLDILIRTNSPTVAESVTNLKAFTGRINDFAAKLDQTLETNRTELNKAMKNIESATERADRLLSDVEQGKGLAGSLLKDEQLAIYTAGVLSNFMVFSSNLNQRGLWGVLRKPKTEKNK